MDSDRDLSTGDGDDVAAFEWHYVKDFEATFMLSTTAVWGREMPVVVFTYRLDERRTLVPELTLVMN